MNGHTEVAKLPVLHTVMTFNLSLPFSLLIFSTNHSAPILLISLHRSRSSFSIAWHVLTTSSANAFAASSEEAPVGVEVDFTVFRIRSIPSCKLTAVGREDSR